LNTERVVPIDDSVCQLVHRLRFFRMFRRTLSDSSGAASPVFDRLVNPASGQG
jgi:hypothetical protein